MSNDLIISAESHTNLSSMSGGYNNVLSLPKSPQGEAGSISVCLRAFYGRLVC